MKTQYLVMAAIAAVALVLYGKNKSGKDQSLSAGAQKAFDAAKSFAAKLKKDGRKNVKVVRIEGGPNGFPKAYMVSFGDPQKPSFQTFAAVYS